MIIIKMEQDKSLLVTRQPILHQFEHKADQLLFLIPPNIDNVDLANANVIARFILPSGMWMTKGLARKEELYQNYAQYVTSLTSVMTAEAGEIELCLSIVDKQGAVVLRSSPAFLRILPSISSDELLEEGQLDQLDWLTMQLARMETRVEETDAKKADNLIFDAETSTIQLTANGIPIGDRIYVCTDTGECITDIVITEEGEMVLRFSDGTEKTLGSMLDVSGAVYVPHIDDRKILTFTVEEKPGDIPGPVDLNPVDEWSDIDGSQVIILIPLIRQNRLRGFFRIDDPAAGTLEEVAKIGRQLSYSIVPSLERHKLVKHLKHLSYHDQLTGALNRHALNDLTENGDLAFSAGFLLCDINGLKSINELHGHHGGDKAICRVYETLISVFPEDSVYRMGGDEFFVLYRCAQQEMFDIQVQLFRRMAMENNCQLSTGAVWTEDASQDFTGLLKAADTVMHEEK